jgi:hypothetical protein
MNIEFTADEYRDLLDIVHIADVVLSGHRREPDKRSERHRALIQRLYARAQGEGLGQFMRLDPKTGASIPTPEFEENTLAHVAIEEFGDHLFWDELISRLAVRDAAFAAGGMDRLNALSDSDRQAAEGPVRQGYIEEFSKNGIANLVVIDRFTLGGNEPVRTSD